MKDLQIQALHHIQEIPHLIRDDVSLFRHPERIETNKLYSQLSELYQ
ncbi:hypothetical protein [Legionella bononiensis]|nr:hypothetical protein [Legionella bononiensis]